MNVIVYSVMTLGMLCYVIVFANNGRSGNCRNQRKSYFLLESVVNFMVINKTSIVRSFDEY